MVTVCELPLSPYARKVKITPAGTDVAFAEQLPEGRGAGVAADDMEQRIVRCRDELR